MKNTNANTLRTQRFIARFGKSALHPLCQAALRFWKIDTEFSALTKQLQGAKKLTNDVKQLRRTLAKLANWFADQKRKEVAQAAAKLREIDNELLPKAQKCHEANLKLLSGRDWDFDRKVASVLFERECTIYKTNNAAQKALQRTRKRWHAITNGKPLKDSDVRALAILKMVSDKAIKGAWARDGAGAGYLEAMRGGERPLSDEFWQGRLTAKEIADVTGVNAKKIRRDAERLGIRLDEDQRGRPFKAPFRTKQKAKIPRGRPRETVELVSVENIDGIQLSEAWEEFVSAEPDAIKLRDEVRSLRGQVKQMFRDAQKLGRGSRYMKPRR